MRLSRAITAVDTHVCGEPGRVITGGVLDVPGATMFEKRLYLERHADHLRKLMLREPRGYPAANCNLILPPTHPEAQAGYIIMEQVEYPAMSGTNTIAVTTVLLETGMIPMVEPVTELTLESPAGLIRVRAEVAHGKVTGVTFRDVPAFGVSLDFGEGGDGGRYDSERCQPVVPSLPTCFLPITVSSSETCRSTRTRSLPPWRRRCLEERVRNAGRGPRRSTGTTSGRPLICHGVATRFVST